MSRPLSIVLLTMLWGACASSPPAPPKPERLRVPDGCLSDLSGHWVHDDAAWQYDAFDDGGTLTLEVFHHFTPDAGRRFRAFSKLKDAGPDFTFDAGPPVPSEPSARVVLNRTARGFIGEARAQVTHPVGRTCQARWKTEVLSCADGGLTLRSEASVALGDVCQPPVNPQPTVELEHHLVRSP